MQKRDLLKCQLTFLCSSVDRIKSEPENETIIYVMV